MVQQETNTSEAAELREEGADRAVSGEQSSEDHVNTCVAHGHQLAQPIRILPHRDEPQSVAINTLAH